MHDTPATLSPDAHIYKPIGNTYMLKVTVIDYETATEILEVMHEGTSETFDLGSGNAVRGSHPEFGQIVLSINAAGESFYVTA